MPCFAHDDGFVAHRGHVGAAGRARAHHDGDLRDSAHGQVRLVVEYPAEMLAVRKHLVLQRQVRAARIHEVDAGQAVLERDLLRAQVLLHRDRVVRAALHRRVVRDHHAARGRECCRCRTRDLPQARCRRTCPPAASGRSRATPRQDRAAPRCARARAACRARCACGRRPRRRPSPRASRVRSSSTSARMCAGVAAELLGAGIDARVALHALGRANISRPISMRRISLVPAPIS